MDMQGSFGNPSARVSMADRQIPYTEPVEATTLASFPLSHQTLSTRLQSNPDQDQSNPPIEAPRENRAFPHSDFVRFDPYNQLMNSAQDESRVFQNSQVAPSPPNPQMGTSPHNWSQNFRPLNRPRTGVNNHITSRQQELIVRLPLQNSRSQPPQPSLQTPRALTQRHLDTTSNSRTAPKFGRTTIDFKALQYIGDVNENLVCAVCYCPFDNPAKLPCDHLFCSVCLKESLANQPQGSRCCPACRTSVDNSSISAAPRIIKQMVDELKVKCPSDRCNEKVARSSIQHHIDAYCAYAEVECPASFCPHWVYRKDTEFRRCLHQKTSCTNCGLSLMERDVDAHQKNQCNNRPTSCPDCKARVYRYDLSAHVDVCPEALVPCVAAPYGCDLIAKRREIGAHASSCALAKLEPVLRQQNEQLQAHEIALKHLTRKNAILEGSFATIQETLSPMTSLVGGPTSTTPTTDGGPFDSTAHHLLCLYESLREEIHRVSATISELDAKATMMVMNESLRVKEDFAHANSAIGGLRMQLHWLTSARLQNQQRVAMVRGQHGGDLGSYAGPPASETVAGPSSTLGEATRRTSDLTRQETKL